MAHRFMDVCMAVKVEGLCVCLEGLEGRRKRSANMHVEKKEIGECKGLGWLVSVVNISVLCTSLHPTEI